MIIFPDGKPVPHGKTVTIDHYENTFTVKVSSTQNVKEETLKRIIENHFKVLNIDLTDSNAIALNVAVD